jgi:hypothetical protein
VYITGSQPKPTLKHWNLIATPSPAAACVIAQQYFSAVFLSLRFLSHKETFSASSKMLFHFHSFFKKKVAFFYVFFDRESCNDSWEMTNATHNSFLCIYFYF